MTRKNAYYSAKQAEEYADACGSFLPQRPEDTQMTHIQFWRLWDRWGRMYQVARSVAKNIARELA